MSLFWIALLFLTFIWPCAVYLYEPPTPMGILLALGAILFCFVGYQRQQKLDRVAAIKSSLLYCTYVLLAQGAVFSFYYLIAARTHEESFFAALSGKILQLAGLQTVTEGSRMYINGQLGTIAFASSLEKAGVVYFLLLAVGGTLTLMLGKSHLRHFAGFLGITFAYAVLRYTFVIMLYETYPFHSLFWERAITFVTFIPYAFLLMMTFKGHPAPAAVLRFRGFQRSKNVITGVLAFLLIFSGVSFFGFRDYGKEKEGRVLVDEYHSDWEWTTDVYGEQWFGERSGYNYYCFFNYLDRFYNTRRNMDPIDENTLKNTDVFIMKTPTKPFAEDEIQSILSFVAQGGGLYLIGDHTNVFGTGTNLNQLAKSFGLRFNYDCTYELVNGTLSEFDPPKLLTHPCLNGLPYFLFATSNTLSAKWQAEEVMIGYGLKNLPADYSQKNFFPENTNDPRLEFGLFLQSAGVSYGKGRVLAFTDSTVFSNFWMFMPGKPELLLGSVQWLNRENILPVAPREITAVFLASMAVLNSVWLYRNRARFPSGAFVASGMAALLVVSCLFSAMGKQSLHLPEPIKPMTHIRFDREYSQFHLPDRLEGFLAHMNQQLNTFYVWTQRLDYFPGTDDRLSDALDSGDLAVMAKPGREIENPEKILAQISAGGKLLILDNKTTGGFSGGLLEQIGMGLADGEMAKTADYDEIQGIPLTENASVVSGGTALMWDENGNAIFAVKSVGDGLVAVFSDPDLFYNLELGDVSANLTEKTSILTSLEFKMLRSLLDNDFV